MASALVLVTGFGPFAKRRFNPSRVIAAALAQDPPPGLRVRSIELPVSFLRAPEEVARFVARHARARPVLLLGLGVQKRAYFRFERCARGRYHKPRADNDGVQARDLLGSLGPTLRTPLDLKLFCKLLQQFGAPDVRISNDAGGYVCERTYYALLSAGLRHRIPTLFLHVPPAGAMRSARQTRLVRELLATYLTQPAKSTHQRRS